MGKEGEGTHYIDDIGHRGGKGKGLGVRPPVRITNGCQNREDARGYNSGT